MPKKIDFNPIEGDFDLVTIEGSIPEYTVDPTTPTPQTAWVLYSNSSSGGGVASLFIGGFPLTTPGSVTNNYTLKYRTLESTTVSVALS